MTVIDLLERISVRSILATLRTLTPLWSDELLRFLWRSEVWFASCCCVHLHIFNLLWDSTRSRIESFRGACRLFALVGKATDKKHFCPASWLLSLATCGWVF